MQTDLLLKNPLFKNFDTTQLAYLQANSKIMELEADTYLRIQDDNPIDFLVLLEGEWTMERHLRGIKKPMIFSSNKIGSWHGGIDLVDMMAPATVKTDAASKILSIPKKAMNDMIKRNFPITIHIIKGIKFGAEMFEEILEMQQ